jgi:predicted  nucleic acid-binding Zn-ribbon protein
VRQQQQQQWMHGNSSSKLSADAVLQLQRSLQQLQQELAAAVQERDAAQEQLYQAVRRADAAAAALQDADKWKQGQQEVNRKVSAVAAVWCGHVSHFRDAVEELLCQVSL